jgi:response regulator of citrate/malate metabolism
VIDVLIVDDDFTVARIHQGFVERTPGFQVVGVAHNGAEALAAAERLQPDLVLLDVYLPDTSGLDLLKQLREATPELDVLVISAAREVETVRKALRGGIVHYLMKPFAYDDLRERLEHYQRTYAALDSSEQQPDQADVDRVFGLRPADARLPKGFSAETLRLVAEALRESPEDLSAAEMAAALGLSRVSARRYLEHLVEANKAEVTLRYGGVGRPERRYAWRSAAHG